MVYVHTAATSSHAALMVSPRTRARTPNAAAPSRAIATHSRRFTTAKVRRALPMFKLEHRFETLGPNVMVHESAGRIGSRRGGRAGTAGSAAPRREASRAGCRRGRRGAGAAAPGGARALVGRGRPRPHIWRAFRARG